MASPPPVVRRTETRWGYAGSRVGLMGFVANLDSVCALLEAMEDVLPRFDVEIVPGAAVPAATKAYESVERYR
jgi:aspartate aminotransferase-like enzyme